MTLNNILISKADASKKPYIDDDVDISKISLANLISDTDSKLWNFIYLLTMNKTLRQDIEEECGVDWSSQICHSSESNTLKERTYKILMVISLCLFLCNDKASLMQMMLSNITASFSGSSELNKILNQFGITVSYESLHCYITKVVNLMNEDNMKMSFVPNGFVLTSIDNIDKGTPHASLSFGSSKYGLHGTSVQALQPKSHSIKNSPDDYVMFQRQSSINELEQSLFPLRVYPDGRCLFRSVASRLEQQLPICQRNNGGVSVDPILFKLETKLADLLRDRTVSVLKSNLTFFQQLDSVILHTLCKKESGNFYSSFSDRPESMLKFDEYTGVPEILGIVYGSNCPMHIYHESNRKYVCGMKYGDDTFTNIEPIRLLYS